MKIDERKLNSIFLFLKNSKEFSNIERKFYYKFLFGGCDNKTERFNRLVYSVFNSSSQPNLDQFLDSYLILINSWKKCSGSLLKFIDVNNHVKSYSFFGGVNKAVLNAISAGTATQFSNNAYQGARWYKPLNDSKGIRMKTTDNFLFICLLFLQLGLSKNVRVF